MELIVIDLYVVSCVLVRDTRIRHGVGKTSTFPSLTPMNQIFGVGFYVEVTHRK